MRILVNMQYYQGKSIRGLSIFHALQDYIEGWTELREDLFVYVLLPARTGRAPKWDYTEEDLPNERCGILEAIPFGVMSGETVVNPTINLVPSPDEARYHFPKMFEWYYDVCFDLRGLHVPHLKTILNRGVRQKSEYTPVVLLCHDAVVKSKEDHYEEKTALMELYNVLQADDVIFYTESDRTAIAKENCLRWATPAQARWLLSRQISKVPMEFGRIEKLRPQFDEKRKSRKTVALGYFASFWKAKRVGEIMSIFNKIHAMYGSKLTVTSMKKKLPEIMDQSWIDFFPECGRDQYIPKLGESDVVIVGSQHETGGRGYWEALMAGNVLVVKREEWNHAFVPDWYPYVGDTWEEVEKLTFYVVKNIEEARKESAKLEMHIKELLDYRNSSKIILDVFDSVIPEKRDSYGGKIADLVTKAVTNVADKKKKFTLTDVNIETGKLANNRMKLLDTKFMSPKTFCRMIETCGYVDDHRSIIPTFHLEK